MRHIFIAWCLQCRFEEKNHCFSDFNTSQYNMQRLFVLMFILSILKWQKLERINNFLSEWLYVISRTSFIIANWNGSRRCKTQISTRQWSLTMVIDKWISANIGAAQPYNFLTKYERPKRLQRWNEVYHGFACSSRYVQWRKTMITHIQCKLIEFCISELILCDSLSICQQK